MSPQSVSIRTSWQIGPLCRVHEPFSRTLVLHRTVRRRFFRIFFSQVALFSWLSSVPEMRVKRGVRMLLLSACIATLVYVLLIGNASRYRPRKRKLQSVPSQAAIFFNAEAYIRNGRSNKRRQEDPFSRHAFHVSNSDSLRPDRHIPDARHSSCQEQPYDTSLFPSVSVVIAFHNEARSALLRTVMSVLNRTPPELLQEIILVDDFSADASDGEELLPLPKVQLLRNLKREGLIRSRSKGAEKALGEALVFLDSHCEVNVGWLEPLLQRIVENSKTVASPVIDIIDPENFVYKPSSAELKGGFDWGLRFKWMPFNRQEKKEQAQPFKTPVVPGGLFLIHKAWFDMLGGFDPGLDIWGAENFEISLKTWLCGGQVECVPCSRVGHIFRKRHPYTFPNGSAVTYHRNSRRVVEVWFDEYKRFFYEAKPLAKEIPMGSVEDRLKMKASLNCKPFKWYLENVYPELRLPNADAVAFGQVRQGDSGCLALKAHQNAIETYLASCLQAKDVPEWAYTNTQDLRSDGKCLSAKKKPQNTYLIYVEPCNGSSYQKWTRRQRLLIHDDTGLCLDSSSQPALTLSECERPSYSQQWDFAVELQALDASVIR